MTVSIQEITRYIDKQINKTPETCRKINLNHVAKHFGMSPRWLSMLFQRKLKTSPGQYIRQRKFKRIERMCTTPGWKSLTKLFPQMGVGSRNSFYRLVGRMTGNTPGKRYRKYQRVPAYKLGPYPVKKRRKFSVETRVRIIRDYLKTGQDLSKVLNEREETILRLYYPSGLLKGMTLQEIGSLQHMTRERVRQILVESVQKIFSANHKIKK